MKLINPTVEIMTPISDNVLTFIERCGRTCYKSESKITDSSAVAFIGGIIQNQHLSVIEHVGCTVRFTTDRAIGNELCRHRLTSLSQVSTRYVSYKNKDIEFISPYKEGGADFVMFKAAVEQAEYRYKQLMIQGSKPEMARSVLPLATATEIVCTANLREWRLIFKLRCSPKAHPQMQQIMVPLLSYFKQRIPVVFDDIPISDAAIKLGLPFAEVKEVF